MTDSKDQYVDVSVKRLAMIYAEALLNAAEAAHCGPQVLEEIDSLIDDVFAKDARLDDLLAGAAVGHHVRTEALAKAFKGRASNVFYKFLLILNDRDRLNLIRPIRLALHELYDERVRRIRVYVYSAIPLDDAFQARITAVAQRHFQLEPVLVLQVDKAMLGGLKLRIGDKVYDGSVRTNIDNLRNQLIARSSHEIQSRRDRFSSAE
jgi:F-type H+-transporting ATPase subunit delta